MKFKINYLDHVALYSADVQSSIKWYKEVLGLKLYDKEVWNGIPVFMLAGKTGLAIFPAKSEAGTVDARNSIAIEHFAFNVSRDDLDRAMTHYKELGIEFDFQDHHYFHSIYTRDPDGHKVELTAIVVPEETFFNDSE